MSQKGSLYGIIIFIIIEFTLLQISIDEREINTEVNQIAKNVDERTDFNFSVSSELNQIKILFEESYRSLFSIRNDYYDVSPYYIFAIILRDSGFIVDRNYDTSNLNMEFLNNYELLVIANTAFTKVIGFNFVIYSYVFIFIVLKKKKYSCK